MEEPENTPAEVEKNFHNYAGSKIPWYVRVIWLGFWTFAIYYTVRYLFPSLQLELLNPS